MNEKVGVVLDSWMPFLLLMGLFLACLVSLIRDGVINGVLGGLVLFVLLIMSLHYLPNKKKKEESDGDGFLLDEKKKRK